MSSSSLNLLVASNCGGGVDARVAADMTLDIEARNARSRVLILMSGPN